IRNVLRREAVAFDATGKWFERAHNAFEQRRLARPVWADDCDQGAGLDSPVKMMHRRMSVIAQCQIAEVQGASHHPTPIKEPSSPTARQPRGWQPTLRQGPGARKATCAESTAVQPPADGLCRDACAGGGGGDGSAWRFFELLQYNVFAAGLPARPARRFHGRDARARLAHG